MRIIICSRPIHNESRDPEQYERVRVVAKTPISNPGHERNSSRVPKTGGFTQLRHVLR